MGKTTFVNWLVYLRSYDTSETAEFLLNLLFYLLN